MNVVCLTGRLEDAPKCLETKTGKPFSTFNLSVQHPFFEGQSSVFQCTAWRKADEVARTLQAGAFVAVTGMLEQRKFNEREVIGVSVDRIEALSAAAGSKSDAVDADDPFSNE